MQQLRHQLTASPGLSSARLPLDCVRACLAVHLFHLRMDALAGVFWGTSLGGRRVLTGEIVRQGGHDGDAKDWERPSYDEGSHVVARDIFEVP